MCTISKEQEEIYRKEYEGNKNYFILPYQDESGYKHERKKIISKIEQNYSIPLHPSIEIIPFLLILLFHFLSKLTQQIPFF